MRRESMRASSGVPLADGGRTSDRDQSSFSHCRPSTNQDVKEKLSWCLSLSWKMDLTPAENTPRSASAPARAQSHPQPESKSSTKFRDVPPETLQYYSAQTIFLSSPANPWRGQERANATPRARHHAAKQKNVAFQKVTTLDFPSSPNRSDAESSGVP